MPESVLLKKAKFSSTNRFGRLGAAEESKRQRRYVFQVASGTDFSRPSAALKKSGCQTLTVMLGGTPCSWK